MGNSILSSAELCICGTLGIDKLEFSDAILDVVGGSSAYANLAASYFGPKVSAITRVGKDFPDEFLSDLVAHRINITHIDIDRQNNSYYWHGRYSRSFNSSTTVCFELNTLTNYLPEIQVSSSEIKYLAILSLPLYIQEHLLDRTDISQLVTSIATAPNLLEGQDSARYRLLLKKVTIAFLNSSELKVVSGRKDETEGVREILESGPKCLVVTKGAKGAFMYCDNYVFYTPAKVYSEIKDPTGAGDSFVGAFMGFLSNIMEPTIEDYISAFVVGSAMSSFCIENYGTLGLQHLSNSRIADRIGYIKKGVKEVTQH